MNCGINRCDIFHQPFHYQSYCSSSLKPCWLEFESILSAFGKGDRFDAYSHFVAEGIDDITREFYNKTRHPVIFGRDDDIDMKLDIVRHKKYEDSMHDFRRRKKIIHVIEEISKYYQIPIADLVNPKFTTKNTR